MATTYDSSLRVLRINGIQRAPIPKNTPKRFRLAIFLLSLLKSEMRALVAPLITPPPIPKNNILIRNNKRDNV